MHIHLGKTDGDFTYNNFARFYPYKTRRRVRMSYYPSRIHPSSIITYSTSHPHVSITVGIVFLG